MSKVVSIDGSPVSFSGGRKVSPALVAKLERMLEEAKAGDLLGLVCATVRGDHTATYSGVGYIESYAVAGALACAEAMVVGILRETETGG